MNKRIVIRLGLKCNNHCEFCIFSRSSKSDRMTDRTQGEIKALLNSIKGYTALVLTGGELSLRPDLSDLIAYARSCGFKEIQIQSNGRMFAYQDFCEKIINAGANEFAIALHGPSEKIHDALTGVKGSFKQTVAGIRNLKTLGQYVITNSVVTKTNYKSIPEMANLLVDMGIEHFQFSFVHLIGRAWENRDWIVERKSEVAPYIKKGLRIGLKADRRASVEAMPYCLMEGFEDCVIEKLIPQSRVFELDSVIEDLKNHRVHEKKTKRKECLQCRYNALCEGPWKEYPELFSWEEFKPIPYERTDP
jgi:MoaA/NifB/PqqE/SkfB family radical SAM enzyme